jgi:hypothetical protein
MPARNLAWIAAPSMLAFACAVGTHHGDADATDVPIVVEPDVPDPSPEEAARLAAFDERVQARLRERIGLLERAREVRTERTLARHAEVEAVGGYEASVRARLAEVVESLPRWSGELHARGIELQELLVGELDRLRCAGPELFMVETGDTSMQVHPGTYLILSGCKFGTRDGAVLLTLSGTGEQIALTPRSWKPDTILVEVPDKSGVLDQPATVALVTNTGQRSNDLRVEFRAAREVQVYFGVYFGGESKPTHLETIFGVNFDCPQTVGAPRARRLLWSLMGYHYQWGDLYPATGRDRLIMVLREQWTLVDWFYESQGWSVATVESGNVTSSTYFATSLPDLPAGSTALEFQFDWWVDRMNSSVRYDTAMLVEGPRGTPYAVTPAEAGFKSQEVWDAQWAQLVADGDVPGAPCED